MTVQIQYAYLKQQTWLYRRNYPTELRPVLGLAMKQSLKTGDARVAKARAAEVNAKYEEVVAKARAGQPVSRPEPVRVAAPVFAPVVIVGRRSVGELARAYLQRRARELQHGGYKSVRFSVGLFVSAFGSRAIGSISREDALGFVRKVALLSRYVGKSYRTKGAGLDRLVALSGADKIGPATQRRTVGQVAHFLDWAVYEGELASNPFKSVRVEARGKPNRYEALRDDEVSRLLDLDDAKIGGITPAMLSLRGR